MVDVLAEELARSATEVAGPAGRTLPVVADVTDAAQVEEAVRKVESSLGPVDILVNNAGTFSVIGPVWEVDPAKWFRDVRVNLYGSFLCCRAVARGMVERRRGRIVNMVASGGVGDPHPYSTSYACSKTALMRLTEGLAKELEPHGVKVFALAPPAVLTEMTRFIMDDPGGRKWRPGFHKLFDEGHGYPPEAVAETAVRLAEGEADELTGRYIPVTMNLRELVARASEILKDDLLTLRIRHLP